MTLPELLAATRRLARSPEPLVRDLADLVARELPDGDVGSYRRQLHLVCQAWSTTRDEVAPCVTELVTAVLDQRPSQWLRENADALAEPPTADLVVLTGPIASGKSTVAAALAQVAGEQGLSAAVVDVDEVAEMVAAPGAAPAGLWFAAHQAHGALVARWVKTPIDLIVAVGPIYSVNEQNALLDELDDGVAVHWILLDAPVETTFARALADPTRGVSRQEEFHRRAHERFRALRSQIPAVQVFDTTATGAADVARQVLTALRAG